MSPGNKLASTVSISNSYAPLKCRGKAPKTIDAYGRRVRRLAAFVDHCPDDLDVEALEACFDHLIDTRGWSTVRTDRNDIRFDYFR